MIYNKSSHPVEVKKISIRMWSLRDEIEAALERRMKECEAAGVPLFIDDIKVFYNLNLKAPLTDRSNVIPLRSEASADDINSLMESLKEEEAAPEISESQTPEEVLASLDNNETPKTFNEAEEILAEQALAGVENKKPNPILERPFERQAPDLDKVTYGFCFLSDMNMETLLAFTQDKFLQGQSVVVEFLIPQSFMVTSEVTYCNHFAIRSRIISSTRPDYRVQCQWTFHMPKERDNLRKFLRSVEPAVLEKKKAKKETEDDNLGL